MKLLEKIQRIKNRNNFNSNLLYCYECLKEQEIYRIDEFALDKTLIYCDIDPKEKKLFSPSSDKKEVDLCAYIFLFFHFIGKADSDILDANDYLITYKNYSKVKEKIDKLEGDISFITSSFNFIEQHLEKEKKINKGLFSFKSFDFIRTLKVYVENLVNGNKQTAMIRFIEHDLHFLMNLIDMYKFLFPYILILGSPWYDKKNKKIAEKILIVILNLVNESTLEYLQIQEGNVKENYKTTRILGIFRKANKDLFLFRIDFPHLGEESIHINVHEQVKDNLKYTGYPMPKEEIDKLSLSEEQKEKIFFRDNFFYWFRSDAKKLFSTSGISDQFVIKELNKLLRKYSHYEVFNKREKRRVIKFMNELRETYKKENLCNIVFEDFAEENEKNIELIKEKRKDDFYCDFCNVLFLDVMGKTVNEISVNLSISEKEIVEIQNKDFYKEEKKKYLAE